MARNFHEREPAFREAFDRCAACCGLPLEHLIFDGQKSRLDRTDITQPAIFAVEYALTEMLRAWGVEPDFVLGHSIGEYAAACAAGMLMVEEAGPAVTARGRLMLQHCEPGALLAVVAHETDLRLHLRNHPDVEVALRNASNSVVVGGPRDAIERFHAATVRARLPAKALPVSHAFHTRLMEPMLEPFSDVTANLRSREAVVTFVSSVIGAELRCLGADYWVDHVRRQVRFARALRSLCVHVPEIVVEVGPGRTLIGFAKHELGSSAAHTWLPTLHPGMDDHAALERAIAELPLRNADSP
jgi:acyl transferase domain-containing protein